MDYKCSYFIKGINAADAPQSSPKCLLYVELMALQVKPSNYATVCIAAPSGLPKVFVAQVVFDYLLHVMYRYIIIIYRISLRGERPGHDTLDCALDEFGGRETNSLYAHPVSDPCRFQNKRQNASARVIVWKRIFQSTEVSPKQEVQIHCTYFNRTIWHAR